MARHLLVERLGQGIGGLGPDGVLLSSVRASGPRRLKPVRLLVIVLLSVAAGYALAISVAKAGAPKQTVYELPHGFTVSEPTFLPSALPGPAKRACATRRSA